MASNASTAAEAMRVGGTVPRRYLTTVLFQHKVFCKDCGNPAAPPDRTLLLLHGFPESSFSFHKVVEGLAKLFDRVVLFDFLGYGLSDKPIANYTYSS